MPLPLDPSEGLSSALRTVVLFGGSFDPPHRAHAALPDAVRAAQSGVRSTWLLYIPAARSPHKQRGPMASDAQREEMLRLAIKDVPHTAVWTEEVDRAGLGTPSFTIDTARRARTWLGAHGGGGVKLRLLIGADQAAKFHAWREPRGIIELAEPLVMLRRPSESADELRTAMTSSTFWSAEELTAWSRSVVDLDEDPVSATEIRRLLAGSAAERFSARELVTPAVWKYIEEHGLYRATQA